MSLSVEKDNRQTISDVVVAGAGPAGTGLAIRLARRGLRVTLVERERFPRDKLCGEFISPECLGHFRELGVLGEMLGRGGDRIRRTVFYSKGGRSASVPSEWFGSSGGEGALGLSRAEMDLRLLERARELGVRVREESPVTELLYEDGRVCGVRTGRPGGPGAELRAGLTVDATGRSGVLSKLARRRGAAGDAGGRKRRAGRTAPLVGFKAHFGDARLSPGVCEIYFFRGGYGGLSHVEDGRANHCFLIRSSVVREFGGDADRILQRVVCRNERARETLGPARRLSDWLAVSVGGFGVNELSPAPGLFSVGDAAAFIDPFTGSGMLMALESAELLDGVIAGGDAAPGFVEMAREYGLRHRERFRKRLLVCAAMRRLSLVPGLAGAAVSVLGRSRNLRELLARATRRPGPETGPGI